MLCYGARSKTCLVLSVTLRGCINVGTGVTALGSRAPKILQNTKKCPFYVMFRNCPFSLITNALQVSCPQV